MPVLFSCQTEKLLERNKPLGHWYGISYTNHNTVLVLCNTIDITIVLILDLVLLRKALVSQVMGIFN